jgi:hypothetical protein
MLTEPTLDAAAIDHRIDHPACHPAGAQLDIYPAAARIAADGEHCVGTTVMPMQKPPSRNGICDQGNASPPKAA